MDFPSVSKGDFLLMIGTHIHVMPLFIDHINPGATLYQLLEGISI